MNVPKILFSVNENALENVFYFLLLPSISKISCYQLPSSIVSVIFTNPPIIFTAVCNFPKDSTFRPTNSLPNAIQPSNAK